MTLPNLMDRIVDGPGCVPARQFHPLLEEVDAVIEEGDRACFAPLTPAERKELLLRLAQVLRGAGEHRDATTFASQETCGRTSHAA